MASQPQIPERVRVRVRGLVQGVGFRPFVYGTAQALGLSGWVKNDGEGVILEAEGLRWPVLVERLETHAPPLSRIDGIEVEPVAAEGAGAFAIAASARGKVSTGVTADAAVCADCLSELFDPGDRRYRYPFLNCTNCGPRYTITRHLPYDRPQTSMAPFVMCEACRAEYEDPANRRFHAQPNACAACGPQLSLEPAEIVARLHAGQIAAIKGLGGFHLACDARDEGAVARLRARKARDAKPFAVMVANLASAKRLAAVDDTAAALLASPERPIVLLARAGEALAPGVAPGLSTLALMLPYTPLHYLLFHEAAGRPDGTGWLEEPQDLALIMTSANLSGEPLVIDAAQSADLHDIADAVADHDRAIVVRADDSVTRVIVGRPRLVRRARGYAPRPIRLPRPARPVLALGAHLKTSVCVTRGADAYLSQHIGDLDNAKALRFHEEVVHHLLDCLEVAPQVVAHDLHPDFYSTRAAQDFGLPTLAVQHHHAHIAAVAAEHAVEGPLLGLALDGYGLGSDGTGWGGELLKIDGAGFDRIGHLAALPQPGGDRAAREPWRMAAAALWQLGRTDELIDRYGMPGELLVAMMDKGLNAPPTTACGRWFDAVAGLLGVCSHSRYEAEAPARLESLARCPRVLEGGWRIADGVLDLLPLLDALRGLPPDEGADLFHGTLVAALVDLALPALKTAGERRIALSGGCLVNRILAEGLVEGFAAAGVATLLPVQAPANDGGLAFGQAWVAAQAEL